MSKLMTLSEDGKSATVTDATLGDLLGSLLSTDKAVTGVYGWVRNLILVLLGMSAESWLRAETFKPTLFGGK